MAPADEVAAGWEAVVAVSCMVDVDSLVGDFESDRTLCVLVSGTTVLTVVVERVVTLAVVVVESSVGWYTKDGDQEDDVEVVCLEVLLNWLLVEGGLDPIGSGD